MGYADTEWTADDKGSVVGDDLEKPTPSEAAPPLLADAPDWPQISVCRSAHLGVDNSMQVNDTVEFYTFLIG